MCRITAFIVLCNEGERARPSLERLRRVGQRLIVMHDGPSNEETRALCHDLADRFLEYEKAGCKEPHITRFFAEQRGDADWFVHVDADDVLSSELIREVIALDLSVPKTYAANVVHIRADGTALRYRKNSGRTLKSFLFHISTLEKVIGITHKGFVFNRPPDVLEGLILHHAPHLDFSIGRMVRRDVGFARTDASLRSRNVVVYKDLKLVKVEPASREFRFIDRFRNAHPLISLAPVALYRGVQSVRWLGDARSVPTIMYELKISLVRLVYQVFLCYTIFRLKKGSYTSSG